MAFDVAINQHKGGRNPLLRRVVASRSLSRAPRVLKLWLSVDIAERLGVIDGGRLEVRLGSGQDAGRLLLTRSANDDTGLHVNKRGRQVSTNINVAFLPDVETPLGKEQVELEFEWADDDALIVDYTPLKKREAA